MVPSTQETSQWCLTSLSFTHFLLTSLSLEIFSESQSVSARESNYILNSVFHYLWLHFMCRGLRLCLSPASDWSKDINTGLWLADDGETGQAEIWWEGGGHLEVFIWTWPGFYVFYGQGFLQLLIHREIFIKQNSSARYLHMTGSDTVSFVFTSSLFSSQPGNVFKLFPWYSSLELEKCLANESAWLITRAHCIPSSHLLLSTGKCRVTHDTCHKILTKWCS